MADDISPGDLVRAHQHGEVSTSVPLYDKPEDLGRMSIGSLRWVPAGAVLVVLAVVPGTDTCVPRVLLLASTGEVGWCWPDLDKVND